MKRFTVYLLCLLLALVMAGCSFSSDSSGEGSGDRPLTASGEEYLASVEDDGSAYIEYLGAIMEIEEAEYVHDEFDGDLLCLHILFSNELSSSTSDFDDPDELECLDSAFIVQAVQDGKVIDSRSEGETETIEEDNCFERIEAAESIECEMYFPVDRSKPVTVQVLNPDGGETVMAEINY